MRKISFDGKGSGNILLDYSPFNSCFKAFYNREVKITQIGYGFSFDFLTLSPGFRE
ncbi:MAG: hypothetical protein OXC03_09605 [Flavobacteriaceae bacterium]|nr:hypothetical protein [Flavobacteriaceae bacterium]